MARHQAVFFVAALAVGGAVSMAPAMASGEPETGTIVVEHDAGEQTNDIELQVSLVPVEGDPNPGGLASELVNAGDSVTFEDQLAGGYQVTATFPGEAGQFGSTEIALEAGETETVLLSSLADETDDDRDEAGVEVPTRIDTGLGGSQDVGMQGSSSLPVLYGGIAVAVTGLLGASVVRRARSSR